jgi:hypothetical protein
MINDMYRFKGFDFISYFFGNPLFMIAVTFPVKMY